MPFALYDPESKMYFCDEPSVVIKGKYGAPDKALCWGCVVPKLEWATLYPTRGRALEVQEQEPGFPEIVEWRNQR